MARTLNRLSARFVQTISESGRHADGGGLYLATTGGGRRWVFLFRWQGKPTEMGLGSARSVSLARARELAAMGRDALARGLHPISARAAERQSVTTPDACEDQAPQITFGQCADELLNNLGDSWGNAKHAAQWKMSLKHYAAPLRPMPVAQVATADVLAILQPLWKAKPETASRVRGRIERVLNYAKAMKHRSGENPALWRGHLDQILAKRQRLSRGHHKAMPFIEVPAFLEATHDREAVAARALGFAILTAARSGEVLGAKWEEVDLERATWTIPAQRMKAKREHRIPLSPPACLILEGMAKLRRADEFVFPGQRPGSPLSSMALAMVLRRMEVPVTVHGFRSSFRDWAAECTPIANEVCEAALAHVIGDKAEAAYRRGDLFDKRRELMNAWADYCFPAVETGSGA